MSVSLAGLGGEHFTGGGPLAIKLWAWPLSEGKGGASGAVAHAVTAMLLLSPVGLLPALPAGLAVLAVGRQVKIRPPIATQAHVRLGPMGPQRAQCC